MNIVVTTPTGHIGSVVAQKLLEAGKQVTLLARKPEKVKYLADKGAQVLQGSTDDAQFLKKATAGAQALFVLTPPDFTSRDIQAHYRRFGEAAAEAILVNGIPYVVHLSSVGADLESGNGPIAGLYQNERILRQATRNVIHLRAAYFMENTLGQIESIHKANAMYTMFPTGFRFPMVATRDIGERAAKFLEEPKWSGERIVELHGAADISYDETAMVLSKVLKRGIQHTSIVAGQFQDALLRMGASKVIADGYVEMSEAMIRGRIKFREARTTSNTTRTPYADFAQEVFKPAFDAVAAVGA